MHNFYISGKITEGTFDAFQFFWQTIKNKNSKKIFIYINSTGGCIVSSLRIVQQLLDLSNMGYEIHTFGQKNVMSCAFIIFLCGDENQRTLSKGTSLMFHRGYKPVSINFDLKEDTNIEEKLFLKSFKGTKINLEKNNAFMIAFILKRTLITKELFFKKENRYFNPDIALKIGVAHSVKNTLLTMQELEMFVNYFLENKKFYFKVSEIIEVGIKEKFSNYSEGIITKEEFMNLSIIHIMNNTDIITLKNIKNYK